MTLKPIGSKKNKPCRGITFVASLVRNRELWWRLSEREVIGRYRGSILGWGWSLLLVWLWLACPLTVWPILPSRIRYQVCPPLSQEALFPGRTQEGAEPDEASLRRAYDQVVCSVSQEGLG